MTKCHACDKPLMVEEVKENYNCCFECDINHVVGRLAHHMKEARITFEELIRKLINEVDR